MILELRSIFKNYEQGKLEVPVLKDVSLSVDEGEYVAIMGPSGSGKTTLMNIIGCLDVPTSGDYILEGENMSQQSEARMSEVRLRSLGFVFQSFHLLPRQSALDNVALPLLYAGVKKKDRLEIAQKALERVGLGDRLEFKPTQLSGGQCQRVAIARAIVNNPKLLLADEPTGALDTQSGEQIMETFQKLNDEGVTIIMITHEAEIAAHAQRVLYIRDGQLTDKPVTVQLSEKPAFQEVSLHPNTDFSNTVKEAVPGQEPAGEAPAETIEIPADIFRTLSPTEETAIEAIPVEDSLSGPEVTPETKPEVAPEVSPEPETTAEHVDIPTSVFETVQPDEEPVVEEAAPVAEEAPAAEAVEIPEDVFATAQPEEEISIEDIVVEEISAEPEVAPEVTPEVAPKPAPELESAAETVEIPEDVFATAQPEEEISIEDIVVEEITAEAEVEPETTPEVSAEHVDIPTGVFETVQPDEEPVVEEAAPVEEKAPAAETVEIPEDVFATAQPEEEISIEDIVVEEITAEPKVTPEVTPEVAPETAPESTAEHVDIPTSVFETVQPDEEPVVEEAAPVEEAPAAEAVEIPEDVFATAQPEEEISIEDIVVEEITAEPEVAPEVAPEPAPEPESAAEHVDIPTGVFETVQPDEEPIVEEAALVEEEAPAAETVEIPEDVFATAQPEEEISIEDIVVEEITAEPEVTPEVTPEVAPEPAPEPESTAEHVDIPTGVFEVVQPDEESVVEEAAPVEEEAPAAETVEIPEDVFATAQPEEEQLSLAFVLGDEAADAPAKEENEAEADREPDEKAALSSDQLGWGQFGAPLRTEIDLSKDFVVEEDDPLAWIALVKQREEQAASSDDGAQESTEAAGDSTPGEVDE